MTNGILFGMRLPNGRRQRREVIASGEAEVLGNFLTRNRPLARFT